MDDTAPPLPDLHQGTLNRATLVQYLLDLAHCAQSVQVMAKHGATQMTSDAQALTLSDAGYLLETASARSVQIRYRYDAAWWCDVVTPVGTDTWRLVRIRHDFP